MARPSVIRLRIVGKDGQPVAGANVWAYTDFAGKRASFGVSDRNGLVELLLGGSVKELQLLRIILSDGKMPFCGRNPDREGRYRSGDRIEVDLDLDLKWKDPVPAGRNGIRLPHRDSLRWLFDGTDAKAGEGVLVGIIDSGVDAAHELLSGTSLLERDAFLPLHYDSVSAAAAAVSEHHGTHVAAIISGRTGLAPSAALRSYRVIGPGGGSALANFISAAIRRAVADECDIINISLSDDRQSDLIEQTMDHAFRNGSVVIASAGNGQRSAVAYPARSLFALAVSSIGVRGAYPPDSDEASEESEPYCRSGRNFVARSSNVGPEIDLCAPGVGIISALRGGGLGVMTGTSQAAAAISGLAARLLAAAPQIREAKRDGDRARRISEMVLEAARRLQFGPTPCRYEGRGVPCLKVVITGDPCPESGIWEVIGPPTRRDRFAAGVEMPGFRGQQVTWRLCQ